MFSIFSNYATIVAEKESGRVERAARPGKIIFDMCNTVLLLVSLTTSCHFMLVKPFT